MSPRLLINRTTVQIRFSDVDSLGMVWHGNYVHFFEDGREAFGEEYALRYLDLYKEGCIAPIVHLEVDFKRPLTYGETATVETTYIDTEAAKMVFNYKVFRTSTMELVATGSSTQVFLDLDRRLQVVFPPFFLAWKKKYGILPDSL